MPTYDMKCGSCGHVEETVMSISEYENSKGKLKCQQKILKEGNQKKTKCNGEVAQTVALPHFRMGAGAWYQNGYSSTSSEAWKEMNDARSEHDRLQNRDASDAMGF